MRRRTGWWMVCTLLAACAEEEGLGGVAADAELNTLSDGQWAAVCEDARALVSKRLAEKSVRRGVCLAAASFEHFSGVPEVMAASCELYEGRCLDGELDSINVFGECAQSPPGDCDISNAELERCVRAQLTGLREFGDELDCEELVESGGALLWSDEARDACARVEEKRCAGLFGEVEEPDLGPLPDDALEIGGWEDAIRKKVESLTVAGCSAPPEPSANLDEFALVLADDWSAMVKIPMVFAEWKLVSGSDLQHALDVIERFLTEMDSDKCTAPSYGLGVVLDGVQASVALLIADCRECNGRCLATCN